MLKQNMGGTNISFVFYIIGKGEIKREKKINKKRQARYSFVYRKFSQRKPKSVSFAVLFYYCTFLFNIFSLKRKDAECNSGF